MNFFQSIQTCFRKYFDFTGRAIRSEFWWFQLFFWLVLIATVLVYALSGYDLSRDLPSGFLVGEIILYIPVLTVTSRRLHDIGWSGWIQTPVIFTYLEDLDMIIPGFSDNVLVGFVNDAAMFFFAGILLVCIKRGSLGTNKYGPNPMSPDMEKVFN